MAQEKVGAEDIAHFVDKSVIELFAERRIMPEDRG